MAKKKKSKEPILDLPEDMGCINKAKEGVARKLIKFGEDYKSYLSIKAPVLAKQLEDGGIYNDGKQTIVLDPGDVLIMKGRSAYKETAQDFKDDYVDMCSIPKIRYEAALRAISEFVPHGIIDNRRYKLPFIERVKLLFNGNLYVRVGLPNQSACESAYAYRDIRDIINVYVGKAVLKSNKEVELKKESFIWKKVK